MEIINATWEKRNFGVDTYEIRINADDLKRTEEIKGILKELSGAYVVIKIPVANLTLLHLLEKLGFEFLETQFKLENTLPLPFSEDEKKGHPSLQLRREEVHRDKEAYTKVINLLTENMFHTDRVYLDPLLPRGTSLKRYSNWIMDNIEDKNIPLSLYFFRNTPVCFSTDKIDFENKKAYGLLGGVFEKYQNAGFGIMMVKTSLQYLQSQGIKKVYTQISSNNLPSVRMHLLMGYQVIAEEYVLRKFR